MIYAGIGARETPQAICDMMYLIGMTFAGRGMTLRSGHAPPPLKAKPGTGSADLAFERGCDAASGRKIIRTPSLGGGPKGAEPWALHARQFHPNWDACDEYAKHCHARNSAIMLGDALDTPASLVVCWTPGGAVTGGTGQALRIAAHHAIPVFNLAFVEHQTALWDWVNGK